MPSWIGPWEIGILLVIILVVFGPKRLPELGSSLGKAITGFRKGLKDSEQEIRKAVTEANPVETTTAEATTAEANVTAATETTEEPKQ
jgi:sec-independent protein translocase protein TatA